MPCYVNAIRYAGRIAEKNNSFKAKKARLIFVVADVDDRLFSSFIEHLGRAHQRGRRQPRPARIQILLYAVEMRKIADIIKKPLERAAFFCRHALPSL